MLTPSAAAPPRCCTPAAACLATAPPCCIPRCCTPRFCIRRCCTPRCCTPRCRTCRSRVHSDLTTLQSTCTTLHSAAARISVCARWVVHTTEQARASSVDSYATHSSLVLVPFTVMSASPSTMFKTGCRFCRKITDGRCPKCGTAAYCSAACQLADVPEHALLCGYHGNKKLKGVSPVSRYQQTHPQEWSKVLELCTLGVDRGHFIVVNEGSDYVGIYSWENLQQIMSVGAPEGMKRSVKASLDTAKADQHNIIVLDASGDFYHSRFAIMMQPAKPEEAKQKY